MATSFPGHQVIVIGGGLAGFTAANTVLENGGRVVVLDKMAFCGGNSTKATSGINGSETVTQKQQNISDTNELFFQDTMRGGAKKPEIVKVLTYESGPAVDWLVQKFDLDLSLIAQLGGHSAKRTHRGKERFPGMTITYALMQMCERIHEKNPDLCRIVNKACANKLITDKDGRVIGVEYEKGGQTFRELGPVIICSGGFGADFSNNSLLAKHRPDLMHLPTTNGEHCTGDGIKMGEAAGGKSIDLEWVQVHPTGLVKPDDAEAKLKFLAAEALRGEGGILINAKGERFCNELGRRDYVSGEMWKSFAPFRLVLNSKASTAIHWHCEHYKGRGIMKKFESGEELAKEMGVPSAKIAETFAKYTETAKKVAAEPDQGPYDAYPTGKTHDAFGKKFFNNPEFAMNDVYHVAIVTPVIHYCMGGLEIDTDSRVVGENNKPIPGLYAAGEVAGGVHGNNRLGGNSLLDCVVFGRVSGKHCAKYVYAENVKEVNLKSIAAPIVAETVAAVTGGVPAGQYTLAEVAKHNKKNDCWVVINGQVLDVTKFLKDHPGGELAILTFAGKDATAEFNMIHPKDVVQKYAPYAVIGTLYSGVAAPVAQAVTAKAVEGPVYTLEEVAKHNKKNDCWVAINGQVLDVTKFLKDHPGGELAILTFAGKDATAEFNMIHPADVVKKYAPYAIIGNLASGTSSHVAAPVAQTLSAPLLAGAAGTPIAAEQWWGEARNTSSDFGAFGPSVGSFLSALWSVVLLFALETLKTIFTVKNYSVIHDKSGSTRSAVFLIVFVLIHGLGNLHVYAGPDAFNGYAYFLNRPVPWDTLLLPVEIYLLIAGLLHVLVATVRTVKFKKLSMITDPNLRGQLSMAITGAILFVFLVIHLQQFRLTSDFPLYTFRVKWMYPFYCDRNNTKCEVATFKDLYKMEFQIFESGWWVLFYLFSVGMFITHMNEGWAKITNASSIIPKQHKGKARFIGTLAAWFIGLLYLSYPIFCYFFPVKDWNAYDKEHISSWIKK